MPARRDVYMNAHSGCRGRALQTGLGIYIHTPPLQVSTFLLLKGNQVSRDHILLKVTCCTQRVLSKTAPLLQSVLCLEVPATGRDRLSAGDLRN